MYRFLISLFLLMGCSLVAKSQSETARIVPLDDSRICTGYTSKNIARFKVVYDKPDFLKNEQIFATYTWRAFHPNGDKLWNTSSDTRVVPIPFLGAYQVTCDVEFVVLGNSTPFKVIKSDVAIVIGKNCSVDHYNQSEVLEKDGDRGSKTGNE